MIDRSMGPKPGNAPTEEVGSSLKSTRQSFSKADERRALADTLKPDKTAAACLERASGVELVPESTTGFARQVMAKVQLPNLLSQHLAGPLFIPMDKLTPDGKISAVAFYTNLDNAKVYGIPVQFDPKSGVVDVGKERNCASVAQSVKAAIKAIDEGQTMPPVAKGMKPVASAI